MSARRTVPEPWAAEMVNEGFKDPRTGEPSITALALESGIAVETVRRLLYGIGVPSESTLSAVAKALDIPVPTVRKWAGRPAGERTPYSPPPEADQLNVRQRKAVDELIRSTTAGRTDILLTFRDGTTLAVQLKLRGKQSEYEMTGRVASALEDHFASDLASLVMPAADLQWAPSDVPITVDIPDQDEAPEMSNPGRTKAQHGLAARKRTTQMPAPVDDDGSQGPPGDGV